MSPLPRHLLRDEPLARLAAAGDRGAFEVLFARHRSALLHSARSIVRNEHDAQDAVQSAALKALAGLAGRRDGVPFRPWLFRIAYNESISILRLRRVRPAEALELTLAHPAPGPAQRVIDRAQLRDLIDDLAQLTETQRTALLLRQLNGSSYEEIARVLDTSALAARRSVSTARGNLVAFAEGRDAGCAGVQLTLAAGDRRAMRALSVRAHLRTCATCRTRAEPARRGSRAAALVPVFPVGQLLDGLRSLLSPAAGLSDAAVAPATKALAVAAAVTAGVGAAGVGALHRHHAHPAAAAQRAQVTASSGHRVRHVAHARAHARATPLVVVAPAAAAPQVATVALRRAATHHVHAVARAVAVAVGHGTAGEQWSPAVHASGSSSASSESPPAVSHHDPSHRRAGGSASPDAGHAPSGDGGGSSSSAGVPVATPTGHAPPSASATPVADPAPAPSTSPVADPAPAPSTSSQAAPSAPVPETASSSATPAAARDCAAQTADPAPTDTDSSQVGPHNGPPGALT